MEDFITVAAIVWAILNIILFFKLWGACNDIRRIADKLDPKRKAVRESHPINLLNLTDENLPDELSYPHHSRTPETKEDVERWINEDK